MTASTGTAAKYTHCWEGLMNSVEALDFAIARLDKIRTPRLELAQQLEESITTLRALRDCINEQSPNTVNGDSRQEA